MVVLPHHHTSGSREEHIMGDNYPTGRPGKLEIMGNTLVGQFDYPVVEREDTTGMFAGTVTSVTQHGYQPFILDMGPVVYLKWDSKRGVGASHFTVLV
jgi:hypothetical protein